MAGKRPLGPVIRWDDRQERDVRETPLERRMAYLEAGANIAADLTRDAAENNVEALGAAVVNLTRDQLEAAAMSFAILAAHGAPVVDEHGIGSE
jgi:2-phosphoglycerate kinase